MNLRLPALLFSGALLLSGCASDKSAQQSKGTATAATQQSMEESESAAACPMNLHGAHVQAQEIKNGVALDFTTDDPAEVDTLRRRVRHMVQMYEGHGGHGGHGEHEMGMGGAGMHGNCPHCEAARKGPQPPPLPRDAVSVVITEDLSNGARVVFVPSSAERLQEVRTAVEARAERMNAGTCPMMMMMPPEEG